MNEIVNQLAQSLFKKNSLQECSRWELEILADHYPYFGIAQFLITGKLKDENAEAYEKQLEKTSLYFTNPLWLDYVINNNELPAAATTAPHEPTEEVPATVNHVETKETGRDDFFREEIIIPVEISTAAEDNFVSQIEDEPIAPRETLPPLSTPLFSEKVELPESIAETEPDEADEIEEPAENAGEELKMRPFKFDPLPDPDLKTPFTFEPYHTVDYFASQGIKMLQAEKPKDRFDQQLKSFTQWLKTIKQVPVAELSKELGVDSEQKVIKLAEHSLEDREIVTEAMAEVWTKQGNRQKAIEVYLKLSLQNPAKSAYFASLIEKLKRE